MDNRQKIITSQDELFEYLKAHNLNMTLIAKRMGVSDGIVSGCFNHKPNRLGKPLSFSAANLQRLGEALQSIAADLRSARLVFGGGPLRTTQRGDTYDPSLVEPLKMLSTYFKMNPFALRVIGWNANKKEYVLCRPSSPSYGNVSRDDCDKVNAELDLVADALERARLVGDGAETSGPTAVAARADRQMLLSERRAQAVQGVERGFVFFRVRTDYSAGYTCAAADALLLARLSPDVQPYTDYATGEVSAYIDEERLSQMLPLLLDADRRVLIEDMYLSA